MFGKRLISLAAVVALSIPTMAMARHHAAPTKPAAVKAHVAKHAAKSAKATAKHAGKGANATAKHHTNKHHRAAKHRHAAKAVAARK